MSSHTEHSSQSYGLHTSHLRKIPHLGPLAPAGDPSRTSSFPFFCLFLVPTNPLRLLRSTANPSIRHLHLLPTHSPTQNASSTWRSCSPPSHGRPSTKTRCSCSRTSKTFVHCCSSSSAAACPNSAASTSSKPGPRSLWTDGQYRRVSF